MESFQSSKCCWVIHFELHPFLFIFRICASKIQDFESLQHQNSCQFSTKSISTFFGDSNKCKFFRSQTWMDLGPLTQLRDANARKEVAQHANELWQANVPSVQQKKNRNNKKRKTPQAGVIISETNPKNAMVLFGANPLEITSQQHFASSLIPSLNLTCFKPHCAPTQPSIQQC